MALQAGASPLHGVAWMRRLPSAATLARQLPAGCQARSWTAAALCGSPRWSMRGAQSDLSSSLWQTTTAPSTAPSAKAAPPGAQRTQSAARARRVTTRFGDQAPCGVRVQTTAPESWEQEASCDPDQARPETRWECWHGPTRATGVQFWEGLARSRMEISFSRATARSLPSPDTACAEMLASSRADDTRRSDMLSQNQPAMGFLTLGFSFLGLLMWKQLTSWHVPVCRAATFSHAVCHLNLGAKALRPNRPWRRSTPIQNAVDAAVLEPRALALQRSWIGIGIPPTPRGCVPSSSGPV